MLAVTPVRELLELLRAEGLRAEEDPARLVPPGVLVQVTAFQALTLGGWEVATNVWAIVPDSDHAKATDELVALVNTVLEVVDPDGPITARAAVLAQGASPLPGLIVPVRLAY